MTTQLTSLGISAGLSPTKIPDLSTSTTKPRTWLRIIPAALLTLALATIQARAATVFKEAGGVIVIEAEHYNARTANADGGIWRVIPTETSVPAGTPDMTNARDGAYVRSLPDSAGGGVNHNVAGDALNTPPFIDYSVVITTTGDYKLSMRWGGYDGSSDSIYASIVELKDTDPTQWYRYAKGIPTDFNDPAAGWDSSAAPNDITAGGAEIPAVWNIPTPGTYTIRITQREDGSSLDTICFQRTNLPDPGTPGPAESDLQTGFIISSQPPNKLALPPNTATFDVVAKVGDGGGAITYQWQSMAPGGTAFANIAGATSATYTTPATTEAQSGTKFRVLASNNGTTLTSFAGTLITDSTPPVLQHAYSGPSQTTLTITYNEALASSSTNTTNFTFTGGLTVTSAVLGNGGKTLYLKTSAQTASTAYTVTVNGVKDLAGNGVSASATFKGAVIVPNSLLARKYEGITGTAVANLTSDPKYPDGVTSVSFWPDFGITTFPGTGDTLGDNYGMEVTGFIVPTTTANYEFYIASDDASRLELSTDDSPANARVISFQNGCCNAYTHNPGILSSQPIALVANQRYYVRAYVKEGGGGDFLHIAWRNSVDDGDTTIPPDALSVIPGDNLETGYDPTVALNITQQPASKSAPANTPVSFTVAYSAYSPVYGTAGKVQWQSAPAGSSVFADIPGATQANYTIPLVATTDNGTQYQVVLTLGDTSQTSSVATLTVTTDNVPPTVSKFNGNLTSAIVTFSEPIDDVTGAAATSYSISPGGTIGTITVTTNSAGFGEAKLDLTGLTVGATYTVTIKNVKDKAGNAMAQTTKTFIAYSYYADFNDGNVPAGAYAVGVANVKPAGSAGNNDGSAFLELTAPAGSLNGAFNIGDVLNGGEVTNLTVKLKMYVGNGSGNPADGYSINIADNIDPTTSNSSEEGTGNGLTVTFDTYDNGGGEAPAIDVKWAGTIAAPSVIVPKAVLVNNKWVDIFIQLNGDPTAGTATITVIHDNVKYYDAVEIPFASIVGPKVSIAGRTGGEFERHAIDNVTLIYNAAVPIPQPPTVSITAPADGATLVAGAPATVTTTVVASAGVKNVELFANGTKLGETTTAPYSFPIPSVPAGIYVVTVKVTDNNDAAVTSSAITVTARPPNTTPKVLYLRATAGAFPSDTAAENYLFSRGLDVYDAPALPSVAADADGKVLVVISSTLGSGDILAKFRDVTVGVLAWENNIEDDMLETLNDATLDHNTIAGQLSIDLTAAGAAHQMGAGLPAGPVTVVTTATDLSWGRPVSTATIIAMISGDTNKATIYGIEKGANLIAADGTATGPAAAGRRVHFLMADNTFPLLTADGLKLFDAAVDWARGVGGNTAQPVISISRTGNQLTLTWTNGGTLQQAPTVLGAWTTASTTGTFTTTIPATAGLSFYRVIKP